MEKEKEALLRHVVIFKFKDDASTAAVQKLNDSFNGRLEDFNWKVSFIILESTFEAIHGQDINRFGQKQGKSNMNAIIEMGILLSNSIPIWF